MSRRLARRLPLFFLFSLLTFWWLLLNATPFLNNTPVSKGVFGAVYGVVALVGGLFGVRVARKWGGIKSLLGRAILFLSFGLLAQEFGQLSYSWYYFKGIDVPYPSLGDLGYFGSIPLYTFGVFTLAKASGISFSLRAPINKVIAFVVPLCILIPSYLFFLQGYEFDWSAPLNIFLDFGYPLGQAIYISLALIAFLLLRSSLGGIMKFRVFSILVALLLQFVSDYTFLYQSHRGSWSVGGVNDYMYLVAYFAMSIALVELGSVLEGPREGFAQS